MPPLVAFLLLAGSAEQKAIEHLSREVPSWFRENKCYSCHNNGDGARALYVAARKGYAVAPAALEGTTKWLMTPRQWESNHGDPRFSDKKLSRLQFAAALAEVPDNRTAISEAAAMVAADQLPDGSWAGDTGSPAGSPVTYNASIATWIARGVLTLAGEDRFKNQIRSATAWLTKRQAATTPDAAAIALAVGREDAIQFLRSSQNADGGWGPAPKMASEVFDTAVAMLALRGRGADAAARGRSYLLRTQLEAGGWPETTRPPGGQSYAQHISTTAWGLIALLDSE